MLKTPCYLGCSFVYSCTYIRQDMCTTQRATTSVLSVTQFRSRRVKFQMIFREVRTHTNAHSWKRKYVWTVLSVDKSPRNVISFQLVFGNNRNRWCPQRENPTMVFSGLCATSLYTNFSRRRSSCSSRYIYRGQDRGSILKKQQGSIRRQNKFSSDIDASDGVYPALSGRRVKWPVKGRRIEKKAGKRGRAIVESIVQQFQASSPGYRRERRVKWFRWIKDVPWKLFLVSSIFFHGRFCLLKANDDDPSTPERQCCESQVPLSWFSLGCRLLLWE